MYIPKVSVTYESYANNIRDGFADLQQNRHFVDMTLAADGHHVQVHQTIVALASPYLKELILSIPSKHPVIFLNNINYEELCYLLEYMYTGAVEIPRDKVNCFVKNAKALHVIGIEGEPVFEPDNSDKTDNFVQTESDVLQENNQPQIEISVNGNDITEKNINEGIPVTSNGITPHTISLESALNQGDSLIDCLNTDFEDYPMETQEKEPVNQQTAYNFDQLFQNEVAHITISENNAAQEISENNFGLDDFNNVNYVNENVAQTQGDSANNDSVQTPVPRLTIEFQGASVLPNLSLLPLPNDSQDEQRNNDTDIIPESAKELTSLCDEDIKDSCPRQYTISNRGSIQLIMNRFIYYVHNLTDDGIKRRWRCVDYRYKKCQAYIDTYGETIIKRLNPHVHPFHDDKILKRLSKNIVFTTYTTAAEEFKAGRHLKDAS